MPFRTFNNWLFDGDLCSDFPPPVYDENGKLVVPDLLSYKSPITHTYVISLFVKHMQLNSILNKYFNNPSLWYLDKEELFKTIKKFVIDFNVTRTYVAYYRRKKYSDLFLLLREKFPHLKNYDIELMCEWIDRSPEKQNILQSLGFIEPKKTKIKKQKQKKKKISVEAFLRENFSITEYKE